MTRSNFISMPNNSSQEQLQKETLRIETFSDGVFCIAVTLLSLEVGVKLKEEVSNKALAQALLDEWPIYLSYVISFVNVLLAWIGHHSLFKLLQKSGNAIMITNGLLLMLVALVPFPTKTLGKFLDTDAFKTAAIFYTGYFVLISIAFRLLWYAAARKKENMVAGITEQQVKVTTRNENIGLICNAFIFGVAFLSPWLALALSFVMWVYWIAFA